MKNVITKVPAIAALLLFATPALAQDGGFAGYDGLAFIGVGLTMGLAVLGGGLGQGNAAKAALEGISRNPQASGRITVPMFASLAFIESLVILAFIISYLLQSQIWVAP